MRTSHTVIARRVSRSAALISGALFCAACSSVQQETIVATVGRDPIRLSEYEQQYIKTLGTREAGAATSQDDREKFLDLVVKYRLKLAGAYGEGLDRRPEVVNEISSYKGSLAQTYLTEREIVNPGVRKLYARQNEEIRASHILLTLSPSASPADSAAAYRKAYEIIAAAKGGADFGRLALENSQDPSVKVNRGDLYYFTAGQLVTPFEDAAFGMKVGDISSVPVRTQYGLHIIKIVDRKPAPGEVHAGHIMIRFQTQNPTPEDTAAAYAKIRALKDSLARGVSFEGLAQRHSEDPGSAGRGGDLGYFSRRRWVQPFDEVAMNLKPAQVSDIVRTPYGYHLIKCYDVRPRKSFEAARAELQPIYQQLRYQEDYAKFMERLRAEVHYALNDTTLSRFIAALDSTGTTRDSAWWARIGTPLGAAPLFTLEGKSIPVDSAVRLINERQDLAGTPLRAQNMRGAVDKIGEGLVFSAKADRLSAEVPEFAALLAEYKEGILLYQVEQEHVWNRIVMGDSVLKPYFAANRDKFTWPDRISITAVQAASDSLAGVIARELRAGTSVEAIAAHDSTRMAAPASHRTVFAANSAALDAATRSALAAFAREAKENDAVHFTLTVRPDTSRAKAHRMKLAERRLEAVRSYLTGKLNVPAPRVASVLAALPAGPSLAERPGADIANTLVTEIAGRTSWFAARPETVVLPPSTDERTQRADSLTTGGVTPVFLYKGFFTVARLNGRENARRKTYEEAGPELASAYQDFESKRLESDWLAQLRRTYPVVENTAALRNAFASEKH
ncbi:MAG TPA: peptidylprolyl isomerase [Bacteroidota bacterium]|nr:peptidylprolyl isomerase [Bacteroidota bacterium]